MKVDWGVNCMKVLLSKKLKPQLAILIVGIFALGIALYFVGFGGQEKSVINLTDTYRIKSELLMSAMNSVGICNPKEAATVWANGLKTRSGALQYSVMTAKLKTEYAKQLEKTFPNWVTGTSSPYVTEYKMTKEEKVNENTYHFILMFSTATSAGPAGDYNAHLTITKEGDFWRISEVKTDKGLEAFTGFKS